MKCFRQQTQARNLEAALVAWRSSIYSGLQWRRRGDLDGGGPARRERECVRERSTETESERELEKWFIPTVGAWWWRPRR